MKTIAITFRRKYHENLDEQIEAIKVCAEHNGDEVLDNSICLLIPSGRIIFISTADELNTLGINRVYISSKDILMRNIESAIAFFGEMQVHGIEVWIADENAPYQIEAVVEIYKTIKNPRTLK